MNLFDSSEVYQFAIRIEENGERFYRHLSGSMEDTEAKNLFAYLANEEVEHRKTFEDMLSKVEKYEPPESYPGEYFAYLRAYVDNIIFSQKKLEEELSEIKDSITAVEFCMRRELDSILYYQEMKNFIPPYQHNLLKKVIGEERKHFLKLAEIKKCS